MKLCSDDRGQSIQVGAVLLFGFLILALTIFQAEGVPAENKQVEFDHSKAVAEDMVRLYGTVFDTVADGEPRTASITLGTEYNDRLFFIYPPPATGTLETTELGQLQFHNVTAVEDPETNQSFDNYWRNETRNYTTRAITYSPDYRELGGTADYRIEYGVLAAQYPEETRLRIAENHQPVVDGTDIEVVLVDGDLEAISPDTESVVPERVTDSETIEVKNATNTSSITLELPTELSNETWNESNPDSVLSDQSNVENVTVDDGNASIRLDGNETYELTLHKVEVGSGAVEPEPTYIRNVSYDGTDSTFQVRDEYNDLVEEDVEVSVYNETYNVTRNETVENGETELTPTGNECGVSLDPDINDTAPYGRLNITDACR